MNTKLNPIDMDIQERRRKIYLGTQRLDEPVLIAIENNRFYLQCEYLLKYYTKRLGRRTNTNITVVLCLKEENLFLNNPLIFSLHPNSWLILLGSVHPDHIYAQRQLIDRILLQGVDYEPNQNDVI